ncbi:RnfABCDGE type electron transport complex subunit D [Phycisphaerales bacterium AB-hyl4]|uniref:RnfABCDGE type electron transport complex subunit D n=1 Tax=Natronomicrosphaera hydrolytica TaxID=3242702 RepID=A0ABV4U1J9_9BACT
MNIPRTRSTPPPWVEPVHDRRRIDRQWLLVAVLLLAWGGLFFGYWAVINVAVAAVVALLAHVLGSVARQAVGLGPPLESRGHVLLLGMLGGLALPVMSAVWWPAVAGAVVGLVSAWVGRSHELRLHPVAVLGVVMLSAWLAGHASWSEDLVLDRLRDVGVTTTLPAEVPVDFVEAADSDDAGPWFSRERVARVTEPVEAVLRPSDTLVGDVRDVGEPRVGPLSWFRWESNEADAVARPWLERQVAQEQRAWLLEIDELQEMLGEARLPPLEDVLLGAVPGGVGATGVGLLLLVSLYLVYRRQSSGMMLVSAWGGAAVALLAMPVATADGWQLVGAVLLDSGPTAGAMWVTYALLGTSLVWCVSVLAPMGMPMGTRGRLVYGLLVGAGGVAALWWVAEPWAAYLGLAVAGILARPLDAIR